MAIGILGKKIGMTQVFRSDGTIVPVTVIEAGPCHVLEVRSKGHNGYHAIQLGFGEKKESRVNKPARGRYKKAGVSPKAFIKEIRIAPEDKFEVGQKISVDILSKGDFVDVTGTSIGRGFQGGVKRWHWRGGPESHGSMSHRAPGSIGASAFPSRVLKGQHLPGRMGGEKKTLQSLEVIKVDKDNNLLVIKGAVPGHKNAYLIIKKAKKRKAKPAEESVKPKAPEAKGKEPAAKGKGQAVKGKETKPKQEVKAKEKKTEKK